MVERWGISNIDGNMVLQPECGYWVSITAYKSLEAELAAVKCELEKFIQAVGLASTCVPTMEIDISDPVGMMQKVCDEFNILRSRIAELEAERDRLVADNNRLRNIIHEAELDRLEYIKS